MPYCGITVHTLDSLRIVEPTCRLSSLFPFSLLLPSECGTLGSDLACLMSSFSEPDISFRVVSERVVSHSLHVTGRFLSPCGKTETCLVGRVVFDPDEEGMSVREEGEEVEVGRREEAVLEWSEVSVRVER